MAGCCCVSGGGWLLTLLSLSAQPRSSGGKPTRTAGLPRPEDRKRRCSMNDGGRRPSDPESLSGVLTTVAERYLAWP